MSTASAKSSLPPTDEASAAPVPVVWRSWPVVENWRGAVPLALGAVALLAIVGLQTGNVLYVLLCGAVIGLSAWSWWLPVWYELNTDGLQRTILGRKRQLSWQLVRRCRLGNEGALLLADSGPSSLDWLRGTFVRYGAHRAEIEQMLEHCLKHNTRPRRGSTVRRLPDRGPRPGSTGAQPLRVAPTESGDSIVVQTPTEQTGSRDNPPASGEQSTTQTTALPPQ